MHLPLRAPWLATMGLSFSLSACAPIEDRSRLETDIPPEGYALFRVHAGAALRVAVIVEMRDVDEGEFVLLYTQSPPPSSGWFEIDPDEFFPCRTYGEDPADVVELGCIVPDGRGAIVDVAVASPTSPQKLLRHVPVTRGGYYAVMRVARRGTAVPIAVEASPMHEMDPYDRPWVERIR